jgi:hypothetical protein
MSGVRVSFLADEIGELPAARERFCQLRDDAEASALAPSTEGKAAAARFDWVVLNASLGEAARTLSWFDGLAPAEQSAQHTAIISRVTPMLLERTMGRRGAADPRAAEGHTQAWCHAPHGPHLSDARDRRAPSKHPRTRNA